jgi:hypothetical protein
MEGKVLPDYKQAVAICTNAAQKELVSLALIAVLTPLLVGLALRVEALGGFLAGVIVSGQLLAVFMSTAGGSWDNAKKLIEDGRHGGKGSEAHKASVVGDTVGDPLKDTSGPALNPMIKVMNLVSLLAAPILVQFPTRTPLVWVTLAALAVTIAGAVAYSQREPSAEEDLLRNSPSDEPMDTVAPQPAAVAAVQPRALQEDPRRPIGYCWPIPWKRWASCSRQRSCLLSRAGAGRRARQGHIPGGQALRPTASTGKGPQECVPDARTAQVIGLSRIYRILKASADGGQGPPRHARPQPVHRRPTQARPRPPAPETSTSTRSSAHAPARSACSTLDGQHMTSGRGHHVPQRFTRSSSERTPRAYSRKRRCPTTALTSTASRRWR